VSAASTASYTQRTDSFRCDECGAEMALPLFCDHCGSDYPERRAMSPFAILGLATTFALNSEQIEERELLLTRKLHPDRWQQGNPRMFKKALLAQAAVNESMAAIREPIDRGDTLLGLLAASLVEQVAPEQRANQGFPGEDSSRSVVAEALRWLGEARYWRNLQRTLRGEVPR
jgi:hypothetical protein